MRGQPVYRPGEGLAPLVGPDRDLIRHQIEQLGADPTGWSDKKINDFFAAHAAQG